GAARTGCRTGARGAAAAGAARPAGRPAVGAGATASRHPPGRSPPACGYRRHLRGQGRFLSAHRLGRPLRQRGFRRRGPGRLGVAAVLPGAGDLLADLRGRAAQGPAGAHRGAPAGSRRCLPQHRVAGLARDRRRPQCLGRAAAPPARTGGCPCAAAAGAAACRRRLPRRGRRPAGRDRGRAGAADGAAGPGCRPCRRGPGRGGLVQGAGRRLATACAGRAAHGARGFFQPGRAVMDAAGSPLRPVCGLLGIFVAATTASLAGRMGALALADLRGALGFGFDAASWLGTAHAAAELIAMPFAAWFAITVSVRRFVLWAIGLSGLAALALPLARSLELMLALRALQGLAGGALIPLLMMAALKFLPPRVKLYGLALYSLTATFASTIAVWLVGVWTDGFADWRLVYWQCVPPLALAAALAGW